MEVSYIRVLNAKADLLLCPLFEDVKTLSSYDPVLRKYINDLKKNK
jgi:hypothetical protein